MKVDNIPVTVHILDKEYQILCEDGEQNDLLASARYLDAKMREIRSAGKVIGIERIAVLAALNIAHELMQQTESSEEHRRDLAKRILSLQEKIESALNSNNGLEV